MMKLKLVSRFLILVFCWFVLGENFLAADQGGARAAAKEGERAAVEDMTDGEAQNRMINAYWALACIYYESGSLGKAREMLHSIFQIHIDTPCRKTGENREFALWAEAESKEVKAEFIKKNENRESQVSAVEKKNAIELLTPEYIIDRQMDWVRRQAGLASESIIFAFLFGGISYALFAQAKSHPCMKSTYTFLGSLLTVPAFILFADGASKHSRAKSQLKQMRQARESLSLAPWIDPRRHAAGLSLRYNF